MKARFYRIASHTIEPESMTALEILGTAACLSLLAGWRLYAVVFVAGVAIRTGWWQLPAQLARLDVLSNHWILLVAGLGFACEFFADKIPWLDSIWDAAHTFIRPVGGALVAMSVISPHDPQMQVIFFLLGGGMAMLSHTTKAGARLLINQSPEPFSNIAVSLLEDAAVSVGLWLVMTHPLLVLALSVMAVTIFVWVIRMSWRLLRHQWRGIRNVLGIGGGSNVENAGRPMH